MGGTPLRARHRLVGQADTATRRRQLKRRRPQVYETSLSHLWGLLVSAQVGLNHGSNRVFSAAPRERRPDRLEAREAKVGKSRHGLPCARPPGSTRRLRALPLRHRSQPFCAARPSSPPVVGIRLSSWALLEAVHWPQMKPANLQSPKPRLGSPVSLPILGQYGIEEGLDLEQPLGEGYELQCRGVLTSDVPPSPFHGACGVDRPPLGRARGQCLQVRGRGRLGAYRSRSDRSTSHFRGRRHRPRHSTRGA